MRSFFVASFCLLTIASLHSVVLGQQSSLEISHDTTRILGPLDKDGYVDYVAAFNQMQSKDVTAETNYEVALRRLIGPDDVPESVRKRYFKALGIPIPNEGPFLTDFYTFLSNIGQKTSEEIAEEFNEVLNAPWTADEHFEAEAWLHREQSRIDALVEASKCQHNYMPYIPSVEAEKDEKIPALVSVVLPSAQKHRDLARTLIIRANQRIAAGDCQGAWSDLLATMRIARLSAQGATLIELLVGVAIESMAFDAAEHILNAPDLPQAQIVSMLKDVNELTYMRSTADVVDRGERLMCLEALQVFSREEDLFKAMETLQALSGRMPQKNLDEANKADKEKKSDLTINWNVSAKLINKWYDRLVEACREPNIAVRETAYDLYEKELRELARNKGVGQLLLASIKGNSSDEFGRIMGETIISLFLPALKSANDAYVASLQRLDILRLAFAAKVYQGNNQRYPKELSELESLVPKILHDRFSGQPLQFHSSDDGFVLYSVGRNRKNDLGRDYRDAEERENVQWDDIVMRAH